MKNEIDSYLLNPLLDKIIAVLVGIVVIWLIVRVTQRFLFSKIKDNGHHYKAKKVSNFLGYALTIVLIAFVYSDKLGRFTVAFGVAGAGIAFALQEVIVSFAGWLAILIGGYFKTGDRVQLGGIKGDVMDIGILRTTIMEIGQWVDADLYNGRIVFVANSFVFKEPVFNYSGDLSFLWDEIKVLIKYGSDFEKVKLLLLTIGKEVAGDLSQISREQWNALQNKYRLEDAQTDATIAVVANEKYVEFTLRYVVSYKKRRATKTELFSRILKEIDDLNYVAKT